MKSDLDSYRKQRDALLTTIVEKLSTDERLVAAWLTGGLGRNDADILSDIDLRPVVDGLSNFIIWFMKSNDD